MIPTYPKRAVTTVQTFFLVFFLIISSCSKDNVVDILDSEENGENENPIAPDDSQLENNFVLDESNRVVNYILPKIEYDKYLEDEGDFSLISKKIYEHFNDDFDFIFVLSNEEEVPQDLYYGISYKVQNHVEGIGSGIYDGTVNYGSAGRLKSVIHLPVPGLVKNGPFLHEIMHYWGNQGFVPTTVGGHWGYANVGGQLGGFDALVELGNNTYQGKMEGENGFGTFANGGNSVPYGNLELYLMGLVGVDELKDIQYADNPESQGSGKFTADEIITRTPAQLVSEHGSRIPSVQDSQKEFTGITVILSHEKMSDSELANISTNLENFSRKSAPDGSWNGLYNFWQATQEKATLTIQLSEDNLK
ncbi:hypothetical protein [Maribacter sp. HTCC2170]|uniref:hypothetical protein n=1 Tax=Maribacter sp. (strain HTCC2170 / KCCM 42371) TaxID=313603 RepID=UPI00006B1AE8|nr:hypothetical protein [Maribacter sp. HTCC2170]EAR00781.1 Alpha-tubulin suppressor and related RCC1 domain-containing protein [Maribacter sp. HTCC2170]